jgi:hypothetical protein
MDSVCVPTMPDETCQGMSCSIDFTKKCWQPVS